MHRRLRFFIGIAEIGGYYGNLRRGLEELGHDAVFLNLLPHPNNTGEQGEQPPQALLRLAIRLAHQDVATPRSRLLSKLGRRALSRAGRLWVLVWALATRDVFVYGFATSLFGFRELPLLRLLGKRIVYVFNGSDSRPSYLDGSDMAADRGLSIAECIERTRRKKETVRRIERYADVIVSNPLSSQLHEQRVLSFLALGIPRPPEPPREAKGDDGIVHIVHAPSHPEAKGTPLLRAAVERLRRSGQRVELTELTGLPNQEVLAALRRSDIALDQLYSDTPMGGFAAEAAACGVPAVVGGYGKREMRDAMGGQPFPPVALCHPSDLDRALERLVSDRTARRRLGDEARDFAETRWSCREVAARLVQALEGEAPAAWWFEPESLTYVQGCCLDERKARALVRQVVAAGGTEALAVQDKPALERALVSFAEEEGSRPTQGSANRPA